MADKESQRREILSRLTGKPIAEVSREGLSPLDGLMTNQDIEDEINQACASAFKTGAGKTVLEYLRRLTIERVAGPGVDPNSLLHMEGARWVYGIIASRIEIGKRK